MYNETDVTWSSIEKCYSYGKVVWYTQSNGIPRYTLFDEDGNKINVNIEDCFIEYE